MTTIITNPTPLWFWRADELDYGNLVLKVGEGIFRGVIYAGAYRDTEWSMGPIHAGVNNFDRFNIPGTTADTVQVHDHLRNVNFKQPRTVILPERTGTYVPATRVMLDRRPPPDDDTFHECETCAAKRGLPWLCKGCRHNRDVIAHLTRIIEDEF